MERTTLSVRGARPPRRGRPMVRLALACSLLALAAWALMQAPAPGPSLARYAPPGPLLIVEAKDFASLLTDWNGSREKQAWLASASYEVFSRSRLFLRLAEVQNEFGAAAGLPPDMPLLDSVAGSESALALYDIGNLQFLYITRLPSARALSTALWQKRSSYETRNSAGLDYFIRTDAASHRVAAFATANDYLLVATREDLIAGALSLLAGKPGADATAERWYAEAVRAAGPRGDLRLVLNLADLTRTAHFRSYWIQRNVSELRQYGAAIADVHRTAGEIREERVLLRFDQQTPQPDRASASFSTALALVPPGAGLYRAWAGPSAAAAIALLKQKIVAPGPAAPPRSDFAPAASASSSAGAESDLETRIDEPPLPPASPDRFPAPLRAIIEKAPLDAMLEIGSTRTLAGNVFVAIDTAVVLIGGADWDANAVRDALTSAPEYGSLGRITVEAQGRVLILSNSAALAKQIVARAASPGSAQPATYAAAFNHAGERARYLRMMRLLDNAPGRRGTAAQPQGEGGEEGEAAAQPQGEGGEEGEAAAQPQGQGGEKREAGPAPNDRQTPAFFSDNIGSLSQTLARVASTTIVMRDTGPAVFETVTYRLGEVK
ncbi:MAG: hypothetical protein ABSD27_08910 [Bryobacteraceae bacterium]